MNEEMNKDELIQYLIDALVEYGIIELIDEPKEQGGRVMRTVNYEDIKAEIESIIV